MEAAEQRDAFANLLEREDAGVEAVVEIGGEIGDFVGEVDELRFERRDTGRGNIRPARGEWRRIVVAGVLDDAFADGRGSG